MRKPTLDNKSGESITSETKPFKKFKSLLLVDGLTDGLIGSKVEGVRD